MKYLIGLDVGTSNVKAVLFDLEGNEILVKSEPTDVITFNGNWQEQDMIQVYDQCARCIKGIMDSGVARPEDVLAVGLSGQGEGVWMIDRDGNPVKRASLWSDGRASEILDYLTHENPDLFQYIFSINGSKSTVSNTLLQLAWYKKHMPEIFQPGNTVLNCKDWVRFRLTGNRNMEINDASVSTLHMKEGRYNTECFEALGIADLLQYMPPIIKSYEKAGEITEQASKETGLAVGTTVVGGALDVTITMVGVNAVNVGDIYAILGTTCCTGVVCDLNTLVPGSDKNASHVRHPKDGLCINILATMAGTPNLDWVIESVSNTSDFAEIERHVKDIPAGSGGIIYHPYITPAGERTPFYNPDARAGFFGLSTHSTRWHMVKAVYEGVAYSIKDCLYGVKEQGNIYLAGGGSKSEMWAQIIADVTGRSTVLSEGTEFGAKGAAILAGVCMGVYSDINDAASKLCKVKAKFDPNPKNVAIYDELYQIYRALRIAHMDLWHQREAVVKKYS